MCIDFKWIGEYVAFNIFPRFRIKKLVESKVFVHDVHFLDLVQEHSLFSIISLNGFGGDPIGLNVACLYLSSVPSLSI